MMLNPEEHRRYRRHLQLPEIGEVGQLKLKAARVLVVGAGGLGCPVLQYLAAAGVGTLGIVDADVVDESNLHRQILYGPADVGRSKATTAAEVVARLNPLVATEVHAVRLDTSNAQALVGSFDVVVDGTDNFATRYLLNDACVLLGKPLVSGAIYKFEGQVSVFNHAGGPTYRCLFPVPPGADEAPNCSATGVLGVLPGVVGTAQATETLKVLLNLGEVLAGRLWLFDALTFATRTLRFARRPEQAALYLGTADPTAYAELCQPALPTITAAALRHELAGPAAPLLLDVREPTEYAASHLPGALNLPLSELEARAAEVPATVPVVVYCQAGTRSARAVARLKAGLGLSNLRNLEGGLVGYEG